MATVANNQLNKQQTEILASIDLVIGIASFAALTFLWTRLFHGIGDWDDLTQMGNKYTDIAVFALFSLCTIGEIILALLILRSSKKNRAFPFRKNILITIKIFLFIVSLCGVIILFFSISIIAGIIGTFLLKYKLYSFWVLWSVPDNYMLTPDSDKIYIIGQDL